MTTSTKGSQQADIIGTLAELDRGRFAIECGRELAELNAAVRNTAKKGSIIIRLEVEPGGLKDGRVHQVEVKPTVSIVRPKPDTKKTIFFLTETAQLVRDDPDQMEMFEDQRAPVVEMPERGR